MPTNEHLAQITGQVKEIKRLQKALQAAADHLRSAATWERLYKAGRHRLRDWADEAERAKAVE